MNFSSKHNVEFNLPHIVICGVESAGKTVLLSLLTRSIIGYSGAGLSTTCPVQYIFQRSNTTSYKFEGEECASKRDLLNRIEEHMKSHYGKISSKTITVELLSPEYANFYILDLPGLRFDGQTDAIIDVIKKNLKKETILLLVAESVYDAQQSGDLAELKDKIFSGKYFSHDRQITIMNKVANARIQEYNKKTPDTANLYHYLPSVDVDQIGNDDVGIANRYISEKYPSVEENFIKNLAPSDISVDNIGLTNLEKKLKTIFGSKLSKQSENIMMKLYTMQDETRKELIKLEAEIKTTDVTRLSSWKHKVLSSAITAIGLVHRNKKVHQSTFPKMEFSDWDVHTIADLPPLGFPSNESGIDDSNIYINNRTSGNTLYKLIIAHMKYRILSKTFDTVSDEEAENILGANPKFGLYDVHSLVTELIQERVREIGPAIHWKKDLVLGLIGKSFRNLMENILENNPESAALELLVQQISDAYYTVISRKFDKVIARWEDGIEMYSNDLSIDMCSKTIMMLFTMPMADTLPREPGRLKDIDSDKIDKAETPKAAEERSGLWDRIGLGSENIHSSNHSNPKNRVTYVTKRKALAQVRDYVRQNRRLFKITDTISGNYANLHTVGPDYDPMDYFRDVAYEYYIVLLDRFLFDFEQNYSYRFLQFLGNRDTAVTQEVAAVMDNDDVGVHKLEIAFAGNRDSLLEEVTKKTDKLSEIKDLMQKFKP